MRAERGRSRGIGPVWKKAWLEISSMEGRLVGSRESREAIRSFASLEIGLVSGNS
jgi:hypothetical protein